MAAAIGKQVEQMIIQAKQDSETRVQQELSLAHLQLRRMDATISELTEKVAERVRGKSGPGSAPETPSRVDEAFLAQKVQELEQKWANEVKALKQDLHRTILAHNHNSDLMRHHRDALDEAKAKLDARAGPRSDQVDAQIEQVDRLLRSRQAKYQALDALEERLAALEQHAADAGLVLPPRQQVAQPRMGGAGGKGLNAEAAVFVPRTGGLMQEAGGSGEGDSSSAGEGRATDGGASGPPGLS